MLLAARLWNWLKGEKGQGMAEYGLIIVLVALAAVAAVTFFGDAIKQVFSKIGGQLSTI